MNSWYNICILYVLYTYKLLRDVNFEVFTVNLVIRKIFILKILLATLLLALIAEQDTLEQQRQG